MKFAAKKAATLACALGLGLGVLAAPAGASTTIINDQGTLGVLDSADAITSTFSYQDTETFAAQVAFDNTYELLIGPLSAANAATVNLTVGSAGTTSTNAFDVSDLSLYLYDISNGGSTLVAGGSGVTSITGAILSAGSSYAYEVTGTASGTSGGSYLFGASIAPVPEPENWALFGAGLLTLAAIGRRRFKR